MIVHSNEIRTLADLEKAVQEMKSCLPKGVTADEVYFEHLEISPACARLFTSTLSDYSEVWNVRIR